MSFTPLFLFLARASALMSLQKLRFSVCQKIQGRGAEKTQFVYLLSLPPPPLPPRIELKNPRGPAPVPVLPPLKLLLEFFGLSTSQIPTSVGEKHLMVFVFFFF